MSMATENHQPANHSSSLRRLVSRHPMAAYLVMAFAISWTAILPVLLSESGPFGILPIELPAETFNTLASILGLALPVFLVTAAKDGEEGVRDLLRRIFRWRVGVRWYLFALFGLFVVSLLGAIPFAGVAPLEALTQNWSLLITVYLPGILVPFVLINLWEETAWTGFVQHTLQERHGPLLASVVVAPLFALIHLPAFFVAGWINEEPTPLSHFPSVLVWVGFMAVFAVFLRVLIMWFYNRTGRSILLVGLFHSSFNMVSRQELMPEYVSGLDSGLLAIAVVAVLAVVVVVFTWGRLGYKPERAALRPAEGVGVATQPRVQ